MPKTKDASPARSQGGIPTPKRKSTRGSRSLCSPARSTASGRLTSLIDQFKDKNMESFALSPLNGRSVLNDNTEIEEPGRKSWWKKLDENSQDVMEVLEDNKLTTNNAIEEFVDIEVLSQEKKRYTLDLPDSSDNESINSIVLPQRRLFTQKENQPQNKFGHLIDKRESLAKLHKTNTANIDKTIDVGTRELFRNAKRSKPIFPAALLNISPNNMAADKTKENVLADLKPQVRNIFGKRPANKRKNMFADFIVSESEDEISEIQPKVFGFQKKFEQRRFSAASKGRDPSPSSSITTDIEMDFRNMLPSSTMVENQLEEMMVSTPVKRTRLSKLSEAKESEAGTNTPQPECQKDNTKKHNTIDLEKEGQKCEINKSKSNKSSLTNKSLQKIQKHVKTVEESVESQTEQYSAEDNVDGVQDQIKETEQNKDEEMVDQEIDEDVNNSREDNNEKIEQENKDKVNISKENDEANESEENEDDVNVSQESEDKQNESEEVAMESEEVENEENESEEDEDESNESDNNEDEAIVSHELEAEVNESQEIEEDANESLEVAAEENESQEIEEDANESQEVAVEENESQEIEGDANQSQEIEREADESQEVEEEANESQENAEAANKSEEVIAEVNENEEVDAEVNESQEIEEDANVSQEIEREADESQDVEEEANESQEIDGDDAQDENAEVMSDNGEEAANESQVNEASANESQEVENDEEESNEVASDAEINASEEENQQMNDSDEADKAIAGDSEISDDNQADEMEVDDDNEQESENESEHNEDESHEEKQIEEQNEIEPSDEIVESPSPNVTHDTTGRNRKKHINKSPEVILHDKTNHMDSFTAKGRNTSVRKTKSMISKSLNIRPSLAPHRDSTGFSDGTRNSSAEGSGWDSHRTTRKTLRQTFGKDFTPRKSLRALVMEKSAKRQTDHMEMHSETVKFPLANSTEMPEESNHHVEDIVESDHEMSRQTRLTALEIALQKLKEQNIEKRLKLEAAVRNSLKTPPTSSLSLFKVPNKPAPRRLKPAQIKPKKQLKSLIPLDELPAELIQDMKYKPPKRFRPSNASWITKRLYKFLEDKLEAKYNYKARVRAEKLAETIYNFTKDLRRHKVAPTESVEVLKHEFARLDIVRTHFEFYDFFHEFMPREVRIKVVPDIVNKISLPRHGVFSDILRD